MTNEPTNHVPLAESVIEELVASDGGLPVTTGYRIANQVAAALVVVLGGVLGFGGASLGVSGAGGIPGPGLFPLVIGSLLAVLGIALFIVATLGKLDRSDDTLVPDRIGIRRILITAVATGIFLWILLWIGYALAMTLYVLALLIFVGNRKWLNSVIIAVIFGFGSYYAFTLGLKLHLPGAAIPFIAQLGI